MILRGASLIIVLLIVTSACGGGGGVVSAPTPTPTPVAANPAVGEPSNYVNGRLELVQPAGTAYFAAVNPAETTLSGTYSLSAMGSPAVHAASTIASDRLNEEWRIIQAGWELAVKLPIPQRPWPEQVRPAATVGSTRQFWVCLTSDCRFSQGGQASITATVLAVGSRSIVYVDNRDLGAITTQRAEAVRNTVDNQIWPRVTNVFSKPVNPYNVTGDGPIIFLFSRSVQEVQQGLVGYFRPLDLYPDSLTWPQVGTHSNETDMLYIATDVAVDNVLYSVVAHEFEHLVHFSQKWFVFGAATPESTWVSEGMARVAEDVAGFGFAGAGALPEHVLSFFESADQVSLYNWGVGPAPVFAYYGGAYLFFRYSADRFGNSMLTNNVKSQFVGGANIERATGEPLGRTLVYNGVAMLNSTESLGLTDSRFRYTSVSLASVGRISYGSPGSKSAGSVGFNFVKVVSGGQLVIRAVVTAGSIAPYAGLVR